jgi:hypothetical protein
MQHQMEYEPSEWHIPLVGQELPDEEEWCLAALPLRNTTHLLST